MDWSWIKNRSSRMKFNVYGLEDVFLKYNPG